MRFSLFGVVLLSLGCRPSTEYESCQLSDSELSFDSGDLLCVQVDMHWRAFRQLGKQNRFGGGGSEQLQGAFGHILTSCTDPFPDPFSYYPASIRVGDISITEVGVRKKGFVGSVLQKSEERPSLRVKVDKYVEGQRIANYEKITLNNNLTDLTRVRTCLTYHIFRENGYPAPRCNLANVMMNGESLGLYTHVEDVKEDFLDREFNNHTGSLYEITIVDFSLEHLEQGLGRWEPKTDSTSLDEEYLLNVSKALLSDNESLEEELGAVLDINAFIQFWALETITAHTDGYSANSNNSFVYFDPDRENRGVLIPWGPDDALQTGDLDGESTDDIFASEGIYHVNGGISRRLSQHPEFMGQYLMEIDRMLEENWNEGELLELIDVYVDHVLAVEPSTENYLEEVSALKKWIQSRRETLKQYVDSGGVEGVPGSLECYDPAESEGLNEVGDIVTSTSHSCSTMNGPNMPFEYLLAILVIFRRRRVSVLRRS